MSIVYRRTRNEIPARLEELEHAEEEGVKLELLAAPLRFIGNDEKRLIGVELQKMQLRTPMKVGAVPLPPSPIPTIFWIPTWPLLPLALVPTPFFLKPPPVLSLTRAVTLRLTMFLKTSIPNVFAGGDTVTGSATVILAMGAGRSAAKEIARRLLG